MLYLNENLIMKNILIKYECLTHICLLSNALEHYLLENVSAFHAFYLHMGIAYH